MENKNNKSGINPSLIVAGALALFSAGALWLYYEACKPSERRESGIVRYDRQEIRYAGLIEDFGRGAERKIYVDEKPFGSLDYVITETYSQTQKISETESFPNPRDDQVIFETLKNCGVRNCDAKLRSLKGKRCNG